MSYCCHFSLLLMEIGPLPFNQGLLTAVPEKDRTSIQLPFLQLWQLLIKTERKLTQGQPE